MVLQVLLTGAFGNVGMNAVRFLVNNNNSDKNGSEQQKVHLTCFEKKSPVSLRNYEILLKEFGGGNDKALFDVVWGDLTVLEQVKKAVQGMDAVIHLAAVIPPVAYKIPEIAKKVNVDATMNLLEACSALTKPPRFVYASSYSVQGPRNSDKSVELMTGETPAKPADMYAGHKATCEQHVRTYRGEWSILRIGAVSTSLDGIMHGASLPKEEADLMLYAIPGIQRRHGVHSKDVGKAFGLCAITTKPVSGKVLLIGGDDTWRTTASNFGNAIFEALGIGRIYPEAFRKPSGKRDEAYYYEEWMDTRESQDLLGFQDHTFQDWKNELSEEVGFVQYYFTRMFSPFIRYWLSTRSRYYKANVRKVPHPENDMSFTEIVGGGAKAQ